VTAVLAAGGLLCALAASAAAQPRVIVVVLPAGTTLDELAKGGLSPGVMSTGIGDVPREQTYLDISQGNRIDDSLYDGSLPQLRSTYLRVARWSQIVRRADAAPADLVPGLLGSTLLGAGIRPEPVPAARTAALTVADRSGEIGRVVGGPVGVGVLPAGIGTVRKLATALPADGLIIAFAEPSPGRRTVPIGVAGSGFHGNLTSGSTRTNGYVLSTDLAPTILERFGLATPDEMDGERIHSAGAVDPAAVEELADRIAVIPGRRAPLLIVCLATWSLIAFAVNRIAFGLRRVSLAWLALAFAYMPLMLLAGAWLKPGAVAEGLLVGVGAAALAALTVRFAWGWRGLAIACAVTVCAYAIDVIAGSGLTRLSLLGPNPILGVRFYGLGNELEALFAVMIPAGVGAGLSAWGREGKTVGERGAVVAFLGAGLLGAVIFGAGRFGADVGAAIVLPVGAAVAAASLATGIVRIYGRPAPLNQHGLVLAAVIAAAIAGLALLALIDLVSGGNSHLTRSVLDAGGAGSLAEVAERRLRLSAHDFGQAAGNPLFWIVVLGIGVAVSRRRRIDAWLRPFPPARAGLLGACAAVVVGVLVNDSGATFLTLGALALGAFLTFAWAQASGFSSSPRNAGAQDG